MKGLLFVPPCIAPHLKTLCGMAKQRLYSLKAIFIKKVLT